MSESEDSTAGFGETSDTDYVERLEQNISGTWHSVENAQAFQCDLGYGMCNVLVEHTGAGWVGKLSSVNPPVQEKTAECADLTAAILKLRTLIRDHGLMLQQRGQDLLEIAAGER